MRPVNYDESKVLPYTLPDPLTFEDGTPVATPEDWRRRSDEIFQLFADHVYGRTPREIAAMQVQVQETDTPALNGVAIRRQVRLHFSTARGTAHMDLLIYLPANHTGRVPAFLTLNFKGNHAIHTDPGILLNEGWMMENSGVVDHRATEATRGAASSRFPVERILERGYALVTAYYGDLDPDYDDGFKNGVHALFERTNEPTEWGSIGAWAWGLSRAMDYLEKDHTFDPARIAVTGHSRLGKTALWAGAQDPRFAIILANNSGGGGDALARRDFGETVARITSMFPYWFARNYQLYADNESSMPVDTHELIALLAPRPVYITSAAEDLWADPKGQFLSTVHATPVYELLGVEGMTATEQPPIEQPVLSRVGYHIRSGKHDVTTYDWDRYMDFADKWMK